MENVLTEDVTDWGLTFAINEKDPLTGELTTYDLIEDGENINVTEVCDCRVNINRILKLEMM